MTTKRLTAREAVEANSGKAAQRFGVWLKLYIHVVDNGVWFDILDQRLWIWLLCQAKRPAAGGLQGEVKFVYRVASRALSGRFLGKQVTISRKALKASLRRLEADDRIHVREWKQGTARASAQGGAQGYIVVTVCNFKTYQGRGAEAVPGWDQGRAQGVGNQPGPGGNDGPEPINGPAATRADALQDQGGDQGVGSNRDQRDSKKREERGERSPAAPSPTPTTTSASPDRKKPGTAEPARALAAMLAERTGAPTAWCLDAVRSVVRAGFEPGQVRPLIEVLDGVSSQGLRPATWQDDALCALRGGAAPSGLVPPAPAPVFDPDLGVHRT